MAILISSKQCQIIEGNRYVHVMTIYIWNLFNWLITSLASLFCLFSAITQLGQVRPQRKHPGLLASDAFSDVQTIKMNESMQEKAVTPVICSLSTLNNDSRSNSRLSANYPCYHRERQQICHCFRCPISRNKTRCCEIISQDIIIFTVEWALYRRQMMPDGHHILRV